MANLEKLRRVVGGKIGLDYQNPGDERDLIDEWCSQGVRDVMLRTHCYVATSVLSTTADEWQYDLAYAVMAIKYLWRDGSTEKMIRVDSEQIVEMRESANQDVPGTVIQWAMLGGNQVLVWPTPTEEYQMNIIYVPRPTELSFDTHDPQDPTYGGVPIEYHKAIEYFALAEAADYDDDAGTAQGDRYKALYEAEIRRVKTSLDGKSGRMKWWSLSDKPRISVSSDPSVDLR